MFSILQETTCSYEIKCSVMHRLNHLHALCSNWLDSADWLFSFKLVTETGGGGTKPGEKECSPQRFSPFRLAESHGCRHWELLWSEGGFPLLHSACITLPFFNWSMVIRS